MQALHRRVDVRMSHPLLTGGVAPGGREAWRKAWFSRHILSRAGSASSRSRLDDGYPSDRLGTNLGQTSRLRQDATNEKPHCAGLFECRRRDSNPRHADYDSHEAKVRRPCKSIGNGSSKSRRADECANNCTTFVTEMGLSRAPRSGRLRSVSGCRSSRSSVARCAEIATLRHRFSGVQRPSGLPC